MFRGKILYFLLLALLFSASTTEGYTKVGRTSKKDKREKQLSKIKYTPIKYNIMIKGNLGYLITLEDDFQTFVKPNNKNFYGFGAVAEYHTQSKFAFGIHYDKLNYYNKENSYVFRLNVKTYTASITYKFRTKKVSIPVVSIQFGTATIYAQDISIVETGAKTLKLSAGFIGHTASKFNFRIMLYAQQFYSNDIIDQYLVNGKLKVIGLDVMFGMPL